MPFLGPGFVCMWRRVKEGRQEVKATLTCKYLLAYYMSK